jgi:hypothetical protein
MLSLLVQLFPLEIVDFFNEFLKSGIRRNEPVEDVINKFAVRRNRPLDFIYLPVRIAGHDG